MDYIRAFLTGGVICALVQILMEKTKMMPGRIMVLLVVSGAVLGAVGIYEPFKEWAGAGAGVPPVSYTHLSEALLQVESDDATRVMGFPDDMKLQSCMTLFAAVASEYDVFQRVLDKFFHGEMDKRTLEILG